MSLLVNIKNRKDEKFVAELLGKLGFSSKSVEIDELENIAFGAVMKKNNPKELLAVNEAKADYSKLKKRK
ncbi:MAG: hypothetical protein M3R17_17220 [Bacteroidota bacterium]|nr:hypothetical protein [Bacteroidota bacterium]